MTSMTNPNPLQAILVSNRTKLEAALPSHVNVGDFVRMVMTEVQRNPRLMDCTPQSVFLACMEAATLGVVPNTLGHGYLVPRKGRGGMECHFMPGYRLFVDLARRSGEVKRVDADVIYENDECVYRKGTDPVLQHTPKLTGDRGAPVGAYAIAHMHDGGLQVEFMSVQEIEKARAAGSGNSPAWKDWWSEMAKKVVIKRASKLWPLAVEDQRRLERLTRYDNDAEGVGNPQTQRDTPLLGRLQAFTQEDSPGQAPTAESAIDVDLSGEIEGVEG